MQRVFRSSLVGLLTIAGLAACGDKVTVPPPTTVVPPNVVHNVVVTPSSIGIAVGQSITLAAAVDADAGVTVRTVAWTSSDPTVATVDATGKVTGVKVGTVTVKAAATADPTVSGAAVVTVGSVVSTAPTVTIQSVNNTICGLAGCTSTPVPVQGAAGQLDIILNVDTPVGQTLKSVQATLKCGNDSLTQTQTVSDLAPVSAEAAASPVTISINTAQFNATTGVPALHNNPACTISASATTASGVQSATNSQSIALNNADAVVVNSAFSGGQSGADANGITWRSGSLTVSAIPVLYSGRTISSVTVSLPNAQGSNRSLTLTTSTAGVFSASFPNATSGGTASARIGQLTLTGVATGPNAPILDANGFPVPLTPVVLAVDSNGNDVNLVSTGSTTSFRLDNQSPAAPTVAQIPTRQNGWVNAAYTFTGSGAGNGATQVNYQSGGDVGTAGTVGVGGPTPAGNSTSGLPANTTATYFYKLASAYVPAVDGLVDGNGAIIGTAAGNAGSAGQCTTTGWTQVATANDLPPTTTNLIYVVRVFETDKLGNFRCTDLGTGINAPGFVLAKFGVDKVAPVANYIEPAAGNNAASDKMVVAIGQPTPAFMIGLSDDASGFTATPLASTLIRLAVDPATGVASVPNSTFGCVTPGALNSSGVCTAGNSSTTTPADGGSGADASGCVGCGYFTYSGTARDQARNATTVAARQVVIDRQAPTMGSIAVPATVNPGTSTGGVFLPSNPTAQFSTSATDNLDLINYDYTLTYPNTPSGAAGNFAIRSPATASTQVLGVAFDNVLTTASAFSLSVPAFIRNLAVTDGAGLPNTNGVLPTTVAARVYDAAANPSLVNAATGAGFSNIPPASINISNPTNFRAAPAGQNAGATMTAFVETNAIANVSNCPAAGCAGNVAAANATTIPQFTATVTGNEGANFQFTNPFSQVQFYYLDTVTGEYILIGSAIAPVVTDDVTATHRTFTYTLNTAFDPPAALGAAVTLKVVAVGVNASGDALASPVNANVTLTNP